MERLLDLPLSRKFLIFLVLTAVICGGAYFLFIDEAQSNVTGMRLKLARQRQELDQIKRQFNEERLLRIEASVDALKKSVRENEKLLPTEDEVAEFILKLKSHADTAGLKVIKFSKQSKKYELEYAMVPIKVNVTGNLQQLVRFFLTLAEPQERLVNIEDLDISWLVPRTASDSRAGGTEIGDLYEQLRKSGADKLGALDQNLRQKLNRIMQLDLDSKLGVIRADFIINAFTFLSPSEKANIQRLLRR